LAAAGQIPSDGLVSRAAAEKQALFLGLLEHAPPHVEPGARELVESLAARGIPLAVGSSSRNAEFVLERLELADQFGAIVGGGTLAGKPSPAIFLEAARRLETAPGECIVLEDAVDGVRAAVAAEMKVIAIGPAARFDGLPLDGRVDRLAEITADWLLAF
jgi:HAD superfamily hydrolase (TIGR01509 family)